MHVLVTGARGFLGRYVVAEGLRRGHRVRAMIRPTHPVEELPWHGHPGLDYARVDLRDGDSLSEAVTGVDAVIHCAAVMAGSYQEQIEGTVNTTENLLTAMNAAGVKRLVAISSFSLYAAADLPGGTELSEESPIDAHMDVRDGYARAKHIQEVRIREHAAANGWDLTVLRPGIIYGPGAVWNASLGMAVGPVWLSMGAGSVLPLTYVEHTADAVWLALERPEAVGEIINVVDDDLPTARSYLDALRASGGAAAAVIPVPLGLMNLAATAAWTGNRLLGGKAKLPGLLVPARLHARFKPRAYTNRRLKEILGWSPRYGFREALARSLDGSGEEALQVVSPAREEAP